MAGESHAQRSLAGYSPWGHNEWNVIEVTARVHADWSPDCFLSRSVCLACWWALSLGAEAHVGHGAFCPSVVCSPEPHTGPGNSCYHPELCHSFQRETQTHLHPEPGLATHVFFATNASMTEAQSMCAKGTIRAVTHTHTHAHTSSAQTQSGSGCLSVHRSTGICWKQA